MDVQASSTLSARAGYLGLVTGVGFVALVVLLQVLRGDLSWVHAQLSLYLHGPYGLLLRTAYCTLAAAMALQMLALQRVLVPSARSATVAVLFCCAALGLAGVAIGDSWLPQLAPVLAPFVHLMSANTAFLCVIAAVLLQAWYFRRDPAWRSLHAPAFALALLAFCVLLWNIGFRSAPRGLSQKLAIVLIVAWLLLVAWCQARFPRAGAVPSRGSEDNAGVIQPEEG